jgi:hypothetical protein
MSSGRFRSAAIFGDKKTLQADTSISNDRKEVHLVGVGFIYPVLLKYSAGVGNTLFAGFGIDECFHYSLVSEEP